MRKIFMLSIIWVSALFILGASLTHAEYYNEDSCFKDYVTEKDKDVVVAVNRDTNEIELYWSSENSDWVKPGNEYKAALQKMYNKKLQLREMQARLTQMSDDTMFTTNQGGSGRR